jgi:hypothetical protein
MKHFVATRMEKWKNCESPITLSLVLAIGLDRSVLKSTIGWAQLSAGVLEPILAHPSLKLPHLEGRLIPSIRRFLHQINGAFEIEQPFMPAIQRHDEPFS